MNSEDGNGNVTGNGARTEQALRASELSYRRLFEAAQDGILILDVDTGRINAPFSTNRQFWVRMNGEPPSVGC